MNIKGRDCSEKRRVVTPMAGFSLSFHRFGQQIAEMLNLEVVWEEF